MILELLQTPFFPPPPKKSTTTKKYRLNKFLTRAGLNKTTCETPLCRDKRRGGSYLGTEMDPVDAEIV